MTDDLSRATRHVVRGPAWLRGGFTVLELLLSLFLLAWLASIAYPQVAGMIAAARVENAAKVLAGDLRQAVALASRQGAPVRVEFDDASLELVLRDRSGAVVHRRLLGSGTELPLESAVASAPSVEVFPNRLASAPFSITLVTPFRSLRVVMTRATLIRIEGV